MCHVIWAIRFLHIQSHKIYIYPKYKRPKRKFNIDNNLVTTIDDVDDVGVNTRTHFAKLLASL